MSTFAIGDIQGCFQPFLALLDTIKFNPERDTLWLTGDLVNRGPQSLEVLRYVYALGERHQIILGNHDLHLLAVACGARHQHDDDTLQAILAAPDRDELLTWLRHRPMLVHDQSLSCVMTHAGLAPMWTLPQAISLAHEVEMALRSDGWREAFQNMYGNHPALWHDDLIGYDRVRCIINYLTRMRFCYRDGSLELSNKGTVETKSKELIPWFEVLPRANSDVNIIFGHWAALQGEVGLPNLFALDTGCVWGNALTAMCLEDGRRYQVSCARP